MGSLKSCLGDLCNASTGLMEFIIENLSLKVVGVGLLVVELVYDGSVFDFNFDFSRDMSGRAQLD